jgi:hypothetical protein
MWEEALKAMLDRDSEVTKATSGITREKNQQQTVRGG